MAGNKAVAYMGPREVQVQTIDYPELVLKDGPGVNPKNVGRKCEHGVILQIVSTNICGSDQHMVRGRTTAPKGLILGHELTGMNGVIATWSPQTAIVADDLRALAEAPARLVGPALPGPYDLVASTCLLRPLLGNAFPIPQQESGVRATLRYAGDLISDGWSLLIFPEGERRPTGQLGAFQPGVGLLARRLQVPVIPIHLEGVAQVLPAGRIIPRR